MTSAVTGLGCQVILDCLGGRRGVSLREKQSSMLDSVSDPNRPVPDANHISVMHLDPHSGTDNPGSLHVTTHLSSIYSRWT